MIAKDDKIGKLSKVGMKGIQDSLILFCHESLTGRCTVFKWPWQVLFHVISYPQFWLPIFAYTFSRKSLFAYFCKLRPNKFWSPFLYLFMLDASVSRTFFSFSQNAVFIGKVTITSALLAQYTFTHFKGKQTILYRKTRVGFFSLLS